MRAGTKSRIGRIERGGFAGRADRRREGFRRGADRPAHRSLRGTQPRAVARPARARSPLVRMTESAGESLVVILSIVLIGVISAALRAAAL